MNNYPINYYGANIPSSDAYNQPYGRLNRSQGFIVVNLVSSIKEAEAFPPDQSGNPVFFWNMSANELYMKQFNNIGQAPLYVYKCAGEYTPPDNSGPVIMDYDKRFNELNGKIDNVAAMLAQNMQGYPQMQENQQPVKQMQQGGRNGK